MVPGASRLLVLGSHCGDPPHARVVLLFSQSAHVRPAGPSAGSTLTSATVTSECALILCPFQKGTSKRMPGYPELRQTCLPAFACFSISLQPSKSSSGPRLLGHACACAFTMSDSCGPTDGSPTDRLCPRDFPDKNTGMGYHFLL